jgi:hypothetical protein
MAQGVDGQVYEIETGQNDRGFNIKTALCGKEYNFDEQSLFKTFDEIRIE